MKSKSFILLLLWFFLFVPSCTSQTQATETQVNIPTSTPTHVSKPEIVYSVINSEKDISGKCIINIRLPNQISKDEIKQIADYVFEYDGKGCSPLFIFYFLPGIEPEIHSAWAWSHFNPQLEVTIVGLDLETETTLLSITPVVEGNVIGSWLDSYAGSRLIVISELDDTYQMTSISRDGSQYTQTLELDVASGEERLYLTPRTSYNDYLVIKKNGNLVFYDDHGFIQELIQKTADNE